MKNFTNGALVFRLWTFDGSGEIIAKFQYFSHAKGFARKMAEDDRVTKPGSAKEYFYLAVCESENETSAFFPIEPTRQPQAM